MIPKVSVIITTKNRYELLETAIQSVLFQTYKNLECIVVDDASIDETQKIYETDTRIIYIRIEAKESHGGNYARNLGIKKARGKYLAFLDDDDSWLPLKIEKQLAIEEKHPESVVFCGRKFRKISDNKTIDSVLIPPKKFSGNLSRLIRSTYVTSTSCLFFPKKLLDEVGLFDECLTFWQEYELTIRLAQIAEFYFVPEALVLCLDEVDNRNRISNCMLNWKENILYIRNKHKQLYDELSFMENWYYHATLTKDAFRRSLRSGKKMKIFYYGLLRLLIEYIPSRILKLF